VAFSIEVRARASPFFTVSVLPPAKAISGKLVSIRSGVWQDEFWINPSGTKNRCDDASQPQKHLPGKQK
jgi:hypothetical protein